MTPQAQARPVILFHNLVHARAIAEAAKASKVAVEALTAPGAIRYLGAPLLKTMIDAAALPYAIADCGSVAESAQLALRAGWKRLLFAHPHPAYGDLERLVQAYGAELIPRPAFFSAHPKILDLNGQTDALQSCKAFINNFTP